MTLLSARAKAGKTTLTAHLLRALLGGQGEFLGQPVAFPADGRVALLSEEPDGLVADRLRALGLESDRLLVAFRHQAQGLSFVDVVRQALEQGARLVVVDTVRAWAGIEDENAASDVEAALRPVVSLCQERGASLLLLHHLRKSDGTDGTAHRGSGHLVAMVDVAIEMRRPEGNAPETRRVLRSLSRYPDTPPELVIELQEDTYHALGTGARVQHQQARQALLDTLPGPADEPIPFEARAREGEEAPDCIMARLKAYDLPRSTVQRALAELVAEGVVERHGSGRKGDPFRYRLAPGGENAFPPNPHSIMGGMNSGPRRSQGTQAAAPFGVTADMLQAEGFEPEDDDCIVIGPEADAAPPPADSPPHPLASCPQCRPAPAPWWQWGYQVCRRGPTLVRNVGSAEKHLLRHLPGAAESGPFLAISEALLEEARPRYLVARITGYGTGWLDLTKDPGRPVRHQEPQRAWPLSAFAWEARQPKLPQTGPPA